MVVRFGGGNRYPTIVPIRAASHKNQMSLCGGAKPRCPVVTKVHPTGARPRPGGPGGDHAYIRKTRACIDLNSAHFQSFLLYPPDHAADSLMAPID